MARNKRGSQVRIPRSLSPYLQARANSGGFSHMYDLNVLFPCFNKLYGACYFVGNPLFQVLTLSKYCNPEIFATASIRQM